MLWDHVLELAVFGASGNDVARLYAKFDLTWLRARCSYRLYKLWRGFLEFSRCLIGDGWALLGSVWAVWDASSRPLGRGVLPTNVGGPVGAEVRSGV